MYYIDYRRTWNITSLPKCWLSSWEIWCGFLPRNHVIIRGFSPWNGELFLSLGQSGRPSQEGGVGIVRFAPRLFFMFLFLIPLTIRQQCIIYPQYFSTEPLKINEFSNYRFVFWWGCKKNFPRNHCERSEKSLLQTFWCGIAQSAQFHKSKLNVIACFTMKKHINHNAKLIHT